MEKWRLHRLEEMACGFVERMSKKGGLSPENVESLAVEFASSSRRKNDIDLTEEDDLMQITREQIERITNHVLGLEEGSSRLVVEPSKERISEKKTPAKFSQFEMQKAPTTHLIYERAKEMAKFATKEDIALNEENFSEKIKQLTLKLKEKHPFLFNPETGEPLTPIQRAYIFPYELTEIEKSTKKGVRNATFRYRSEVFKLESYTSEMLKREIGQFMPKGLSSPLRINHSVAGKAMRDEGPVLYLPDLYFGYSLRLAEEHFEQYLSKDFRLCDPLQGLMIACQNLEGLDRDAMSNQRVQAYHLLKNGQNRREEVFGMVITSEDVRFERILYRQSSPNTSSGLIFDPKEM